MRNILVVDDSVFMRRFITQALAATGLNVMEAKNGREALEKCAHETYACVVTDLLMPELDGIGFLKGLREQNIIIPVVVMTADIQQTTRTQCLELGAVTVLNKPPAAEILCEAVERAIGTAITA